MTRIDTAAPSRLAELAEIAAHTFPLACPPSATPRDVAAFIAENLSPARFGEYLDDPDRVVLTAIGGGRIIGYAMLIRGVPDDVDVARAVVARPAVELSKMYVLPEAHGTGVSAALMSAAPPHAGRAEAASEWPGAHQTNPPGQRFYAKHGFAVTGAKTFRLGTRVEQDHAMVRPA